MAHSVLAHAPTLDARRDAFAKRAAASGDEAAELARARRRQAELEVADIVERRRSGLLSSPSPSSPAALARTSSFDNSLSSRPSFDRDGNNSDDAADWILSTRLDVPKQSLEKASSAECVCTTHVLSSLSSDLAALALSGELTELEMSVADLSTLIFEIQELRHSSAPTSDGNPAPTDEIDAALVRLTERLELLGAQFASIEPRAEAVAAGFVADKLAALRESWRSVQSDADTLHEELREDKWLVVFRTVGKQADEMMDSLEKVLTTCHEFVWQVNSGEKSRPDPSSSDPDVSLQAQFTSLHRSFQSKQKYYVPSTSRVLDILEKGISERSTQNGVVLRRYADMRARWRNLLDRLGRVEREMSAVEEGLGARSEQSTPSREGKSAGALLTPGSAARGSPTSSTAARAASPFRKLTKRLSTVSVARATPSAPAVPPVPPLPSTVNGSRVPRPSSAAAGRYGQTSVTVTPPQRPPASSATVGRSSGRPSVFVSESEASITRAKSPTRTMNQSSPDKPRWAFSGKADTSDLVLPLPPSGRPSLGLSPTAATGRAPSQSGRATPTPSGRSVSGSVTNGSRIPASPRRVVSGPVPTHRIPSPPPISWGRDGSDEAEPPTSMMQRAFSPTPSASAASAVSSTSRTSRIPRASIGGSSPPRPSWHPGRDLQTPEPQLSARASRINGLYRSSRKPTMGDRRASTVVSPSLLMRSTTPAPPSGWVPDMRDPLDAEVMRIVRGQPLRVHVDRLDGPQATQARYTFAMGDAPAGKPVMCRTVTRVVKGVDVTKVLARNEAGWTQLDLYLLGLQATSALAS